MKDHHIKLAQLLSLWAIRTRDGEMKWIDEGERGAHHCLSSQQRDVRIEIRHPLNKEWNVFFVRLIDAEGREILDESAPSTSRRDLEAIWRISGGPENEWRNKDRVNQKLDELLAQ